MPWLTFRYDNVMHTKLKDTFDVHGVPVVVVLDAETGQLITKKGRKDICDLSVSCLKNWAEEFPEAVAKQRKLAVGFGIVEQIRKAEEEEERKKKEAEKDD